MGDAGLSLVRSREEVIPAGRSDSGAVQLRGLAFVGGAPNDLTKDVARITRAQFLFELLGEEMDQMIDDLRIVGESQVFTDALGNDMELSGGDVLEADLILNAAQEGFVGESGRIEIGGEDNEEVKGKIEFFAAGEGQEIHAAVEGDNPAVEKFFRADALAAEIINDEDAIIGLHLQGSGVIPGERIELEIQHLDGELAAHTDTGPATEHPTLVKFDGAGRVDALVNAGIKNGDDLRVHFHGVRNPDGIVVDLGQSRGHGGLASARRTIQEN